MKLRKLFMRGRPKSVIGSDIDKAIESNPQSSYQSMIEGGIKNGKIILFKKPESKPISDKVNFDHCLSWYRSAKKIDPILIKNDDGNFLHDLLERYEEFNLLERIELRKLLEELPSSYDFLKEPHIKEKIKI